MNAEPSDVERDRLAARARELEQVFRPLAQELTPGDEPAVIFQADPERGE